MSCRCWPPRMPRSRCCWPVSRNWRECAASALGAARNLARTTWADVEQLGGGWIAEQALAIAVYTALRHPLPDHVLDASRSRVTHSGDSDSTSAIVATSSVLGTAVARVFSSYTGGRGDGYSARANVESP